MTSESFETKIKKWLEQQGYPLEMLVAQAFEQPVTESEVYQFDVIQSDFYKDVDTGQLREIDVVAYTEANYGEDGPNIQISCCIECKLSKDKPWVLFKPNSDIPNVWFDQLDYLAAFTIPTTNSKLGNELLDKAIASQEEIRRLKIFNTKPIGYSIASVNFRDKGKGPDIPYQALNSVVKAAIAQIIKYDEFYKSQGKEHCHIVFPSIVIDGRLFECHLNEEGAVVINEIESGTVVWNNPKPGFPLSVVTIFTKESLNKLVENIREAADALMRRGELL